MRGHSRGLGAGAEHHQSHVLSFVQHLEQLSVLGALAALSSRVVEHSQGAAMLVRGIAKPPVGFAVAKFRLWQFCIDAAEPCLGLGAPWLPQQPALLTWPRVLTLTLGQSTAPRPTPGTQPCFGQGCLLLCSLLGLAKAQESVSSVVTGS